MIQCCKKNTSFSLKIKNQFKVKQNMQVNLLMIWILKKLSGFSTIKIYDNLGTKYD